MKLISPIEEEFRLHQRQKSALDKLGLKKIRDLLFYFPSRYEHFSERKNIINLTEGDKTTVFGEILETNLGKTWKKHMSISEVTLGDNTGVIKAVWFHQPYMAKILKIGDKIALTGKISNQKFGLCLNNPSVEKINNYEALGEGGLILPIYSESAGITSRWLRFVIQRILSSLEEKIADPIPPEILKKYRLPSLSTALIGIHKPRKLKDAEGARKRFAFEEMFLIQITRFKERQERTKCRSFNIDFIQTELDEFLLSFPFKLTASQKKAVGNIAADMQKDSPMSRLLEGDVGSGKTAVAIAASYLAISAGYQVAYMAPTEILAGQHFESFIEYFSKLKFTPKLGLITSSGGQKFPSKINRDESTKISKNQLLKWVGSGEIPILIGTHSLIQDSVKFKNLALVIIDEQHRFGTRQRAILATGKSGDVPHLLSMTATPIPRTLALTIYGDLDLSLLDEMPEGRKYPVTKIVHPKDRDLAYSFIRSEIKKGRQAYIVCPRIDEPDPNKFDALNAKAVVTEAKKMEKDVFPEFNIGVLHGKMTPGEKEDVLSEFKQNKINILIATSVVEVGINIPNATVIIIEGAERFGLAQLHQLRGRVIRSVHQPYCFVFTESKTLKTNERLRAFTTAKNGFELAEHDLRIRGTGELSGNKQWGVSDLGMEALKNIKMVEAARNEAQRLIAQDAQFSQHPPLADRISSCFKNIHFE